MVARCIPMSPEVEVSVQVLCSEDPTELLRFVERASAGGLRPSRLKREGREMEGGEEERERERGKEKGGRRKGRDRREEEGKRKRGGRGSDIWIGSSREGVVAMYSTLIFCFRTLYREALKLSMDSSGQQSSPSLTSLVEWMNKDWGSAETEAIIYSAALHSSRLVWLARRPISTLLVSFLIMASLARPSLPLRLYTGSDSEGRRSS